VIRYYDLLPASFERSGWSRPKLYRRMRIYGIPVGFARPPRKA